MTDRTRRATPRGRPLVGAVGVTSIALGGAMLGATDTVLAAAGIRPTPRSRLVLRARGVTEVLQGVAILGRRRPTVALRSRVIGDVLDLGMLAVAALDPADPRRLAAAAALVAHVGALDVVATRRTAQDVDRPATEGGRGSVATVTIARPVEEVAGIIGELDHLGEVGLTPAPGGRGTEVRLDVTGDRTLAQDLLGRGTSREAALVELRRFKMRLEAGEVSRSAGAPEGPTVTRQLFQRPAHPPG